MSSKNRLQNQRPGIFRPSVSRTGEGSSETVRYISKTDLEKGISFEEYCERLGNPTFIMPEELAEVVWFCWQLPQHICVRDIEIMPTDCPF